MLKDFKINSIFLMVLLINSLSFGQRFAIISDIHGATTATADVSNLVRNWNPDFIICAGDNNYSCYGTIDTQVGQYYHEFIHPYVGTFGIGDTVNRYFPALGNHDEDCGGIATFQTYFNLPGNGRYYDFVKGNVHFFCLNSNPDEPDGVSDNSIQAMWLQNGLQSSSSLYNIVYFHHPAFSSGSVHGSTIYMQWPFKQWGATAVFSGHDHVYERFLICDMLYITCGTGGGNLYSIPTPISGSIFHNIADYGAMIVEADNDSIRFFYKNINDSLVDKYSIFGMQTVVADESDPVDNVSADIYPNPAKDYIRLEIQNSNNKRFRVLLYNIFGQLQFEKDIDIENSTGKIFQKIDVTEMKNGMYILSLTNNKSSLFKKVVISN